MPILDNCINATYEDGNIGASAGSPPVRVYLGSLEDPADYDPDDPSLVYGLDFSKFYNSSYMLLLMV